MDLAPQPPIEKPNFENIKQLYMAYISGKQKESRIKIINGLNSLMQLNELIPGQLKEAEDIAVGVEAWSLLARLQTISHAEKNIGHF